MKIFISFNDIQYELAFSKPLDLSIELDPFSTNQLKAWYAPDAQAVPENAGDMILAVKKGSPVNSYTLHVNIHGSTTHTETSGHIKADLLPIHSGLSSFFFFAQVISVEQDNDKNGIDKSAFNPEKDLLEGIHALIVRTRPNGDWKKKFNYSGRNPVYFNPVWVEEILKRGVEHLLVDTPSVDPESDDGALAAHKAFWRSDIGNYKKRTITEMIYVDNEIKDGLYLLNLCPININLDAGMSRPVIYKMTKK